MEEEIFFLKNVQDGIVRRIMNAIAIFKLSTTVNAPIKFSVASKTLDKATKLTQPPI